MVPPQPVALKNGAVERETAGRDGPPPVQVSGILPIGRNRGFYPADLLFLIYVVAGAVLLALGGDRIGHAGTLLAAHVAAIAGIMLLGRIPRPRHRLLRLLRESYPLILLPVAYLELRFLNRISGGSFHDSVVLGWDQAVFGMHPHLVLARVFPYPFLSETLHFCYLVYECMVPVLGLTLFLQRRHEAFRIFTTAVVLTFYGCYLIYIFFPVQGPFYAAAPPAGLADGFFSHLVRDHLLLAASRGSAFPSSHVAGAIAVSIMAHWFSRRLSYVLFLLTMGIAVATVYGGFHYGIDALAGIALGTAAALTAPKLHALLLRRSRLFYVPLNGVSRRASGDQEADVQALSSSKKAGRSLG